jgi:hypothetical protein
MYTPDGSTRTPVQPASLKMYNCAAGAMLGVDVKVFKCGCLVERARKQLYSYVSLSAFGLKLAPNDFNVQG